jgi:hypothetical protein
MVKGKLKIDGRFEIIDGCLMTHTPGGQLMLRGEVVCVDESIRHMVDENVPEPAPSFIPGEPEPDPDDDDPTEPMADKQTYPGKPTFPDIPKRKRKINIRRQ